MRHAKMLAALLLFVPLGLAPRAQSASECRYAVERYQAAYSDVAPRLRSYARCVDYSRGQDDCSIEFGRLRSAQMTFEAEVQQVRSDCAR